MSKPYTEHQFGAFVAEDRTWRIREMSDLKAAILRADSVAQRVLLRALVTISYAHWEGHIKYVATQYLQHVALRRLTLAELHRQFTRNLFMRRLGTLAPVNARLTERAAFIDDVLNSPSTRFSRFDDGLISTRSNLNFEVLSDICFVCGVDIAVFEPYQSFVDVILLKRRNAVAHGEDVFIGVSDLDTIIDRTIELMRLFGDALENRVYLKQYRAAS